MITVDFTWWGSPNREVERQMKNNAEQLASIVKRDGKMIFNGDYEYEKDLGSYLAIMRYDEKHELMSIEFRPKRF